MINISNLGYEKDAGIFKFTFRNSGYRNSNYEQPSLIYKATTL